jgi:iron complex outermembrane receptor protein
LNRTLLRLCLTGASFLFVIPVPVARPQSTGPPSAGTVRSDLQPTDFPLEQVVVVGDRASLAAAEQNKRDAIGIVDSVVDDDIARLPDLNVTEALQRITGIQIQRDLGEGSSPSIRGLTQMETLLNGREVFTAGTGRNLNFEDMPSEMVSGIDVYKTSSAAQLEGGVGGTIDLRTRRPFDFADREIAGSARLVHGGLAGKNEPQFSLLASDRWRTVSAGEVGALVNVSYQERAFREDQKSSGNPLARTDIVAGRTVIARNGTSETTSVGVRKRTAGYLGLQWRPSPAGEIYAEGSYARFLTNQDSYQVNVEASPTFVPGSATLFPGTDDLKSITWTNAGLSILSFARDTIDRTTLAAVGGAWHLGALTLKSDLSRTQSNQSLFFSGPFLAGTAASFTQDLSPPLPATSIGGTDLLNRANLSYPGIAYRTLPYGGDLTTARVDADYGILGCLFQTLSAGVRFAKRGATNAPGLIFADAPVRGLTGADRPTFLTPNPYHLFPGESSASIGNYLVGNLNSARNPAALRAAFDIIAPIPTSANPASLWRITENTRAAYVMAEFAATNLPIDGNIGLRLGYTRESVSGSQSGPAVGEIRPLAIDSSYVNWLPSANLRYRPGHDLQFRVAASKTVTRPDFNQLSPSLTLIPNSISKLSNQGSAGNPDLKPVRADNLDVSVEKYLGRTTAITITAFRKHVDGFVTSVSNSEVHDGATYEVSRPQNGTGARIQGMELAYQQFYDFLPCNWAGLGLQANYTYVDSESPNSALGVPAPLQNLSRNSLNLIGIYELGGVSVRVAYNWRDKFLSGVTSIVGIGALPIYTQAYGWLDASLRYRFTEKVSLAFEGINLLGTMRRSYYGVTTRPQSAWLDDTQLAVTVTIRI